MHSKTTGEAKDKTMLKEEFSMETLNNMLAEMLIIDLRNLLGNNLFYSATNKNQYLKEIRLVNNKQ